MPDPLISGGSVGRLDGEVLPYADRLGAGASDPFSEALSADDLAERGRRACDARQVEDLARDDAAP